MQVLRGAGRQRWRGASVDTVRQGNTEGSGRQSQGAWEHMKTQGRPGHGRTGVQGGDGQRRAWPTPGRSSYNVMGVPAGDVVVKEMDPTQPNERSTSQTEVPEKHARHVSWSSRSWEEKREEGIVAWPSPGGDGSLSLSFCLSVSGKYTPHTPYKKTRNEMRRGRRAVFRSREHRTECVCVEAGGPALYWCRR